MKIALYTLGCKLNQSETEALASVLKDNGHTIVPLSQDHELTIINTCTVTSKSEQKARRIIRSCNKEKRDIPVIITGCYAQVEPDECNDLSEYAIVVPQDKKDKLIQFFETDDLSDFITLTPDEQKKVILDFIDNRKDQPHNPFIFDSSSFQFHSRGFLKIQDGCDCRCTYCRVPLARGPGVSLDPEQVLKRISLIEKAGYGEIVLTGVNVTAYNYKGIKLGKLLEQIYSMNGKSRIRLSSLEPDAIDPSLGQALSHPRICPHFHIPLQSGSEDILKMMKRRYKPEQVIRAVTILKEIKHDPFLGADVLTGFPGETDRDHSLTLSLIKQCNFSQLHVFRYSPRRGTAAYSYKVQVPEKIKKKRSQELHSLSDMLIKAYHTSWIGKKVELLLEKKIKSTENKGETYRGLSENYLSLLVTGIPPDQAFRSNRIQCIVKEPGFPGRGEYNQQDVL